MEILLIVAALVAVKHFCRVAPRSFETAEIQQLTRSEYRANARKYR